MTAEEKRALVRTRGITLDGLPAIICGASLEFAVVRQLKGYGFEWSWASVARIVAEGGNFKS